MYGGKGAGKCNGAMNNCVNLASTRYFEDNVVQIS